ncbi:serine hydrolase [Granulicella sp. 5B5]|uniref:serine hydrolase domain-containing protein n=1 Tax=Granulicella sp. 5B5 TaxID=1617967 RepID=UPI0015F6D6E1|nr:serine hydrolase domain-containing protein [Granulicella sp. 5B5]QMV18974.1 serine hydrolase [Granulicella sp. 5B5]
MTTDRFAAVVTGFLAACAVSMPALAQRDGVIRRLDGTVLSRAQAEEIAATELKADGVTGAEIAILNHGRLVWSYGFGLRDVAKNLPMTPDTNTWAASITKAVFATWVMQLVEQHELNLDEPVAKILTRPLNEVEHYRVTGSEVVKDPRWQAVTPRMMLSHTSGFANFSGMEPDGKIHIHFTPGTRFAYSGEGLNVLQFALEDRMHLQIADAMAKDIFRPLGMRQTGMVWQPSFEENSALRYDAKGKPIGPTHRNDAKAAGSMVTSANDLALFLEALLAKKILRASTEQQMFTKQIAIHATHEFPPFEASSGNDGEAEGLGYGLGWGLLERTKYGSAFFKEGHGDGAENYVICFPRSGSCMILLTNSDNGELAFRPLLEKLMGDTVTPWVWEGYTRDQVLHNEEHAK